MRLSACSAGTRLGKRFFRRAACLAAVVAAASALAIEDRRRSAGAGEGAPLFAAPWTWSSAARLRGDGHEELAEALRRYGFVAVELEDGEREVLERTLEDFSNVRSFRFPPVPREAADLEDKAAAEMPPAFGHCFNALYAVAAAAAFALLGTSPDRGRHELPPPPCGREGDSRPFESTGGPWPYGASFFNVFNYDHGCLNTHRDRGVLTAVYGAGQPGTLRAEGDPEAAAPEATSLEGGAEGVPATSRLWLRLPGGEGPQWLAPAPGQLLLWAGEGAELAGVEAIEHCVRVDPCGPYIEHSHSTRDPLAAEVGNRRSVALVLDA